MAKNVIHSLPSLPKNLNRFFNIFAANLKKASYMVDGDISKFLEMGPRKELSTTFNLSPSTISFEISFEPNTEKSSLNINWQPLFEGTRYLGTNPYGQRDLKNKIQPYILKSLNQTLDIIEKESHSVDLMNTKLLESDKKYCVRCGNILAKESDICGACGNEQPYLK
jgi:ribosomal protein S27AE